MEKMLEKLEQARQMSEHSRHPIYAYGNGKEITYHASYNDSALRPLLENQGYWVVSIFVNGNRVNA